MTHLNQDDNPFKPGAGHSPPYLAGRDGERDQFMRFLAQKTITDNVVLTGLRGVGKTVLMDDVYKPMALNAGWVWIGSDFSESAFVDELTLCRRILTDLSAYTSNLQIATTHAERMSILPSAAAKITVDHEYLNDLFDSQPGLNSDKLKATLEWVWNSVKHLGKSGVVFAYDEAHYAEDRTKKQQFPLALLLETFHSIQQKGVKMMLLLTGLLTLFPRLVESRTYAERMFKIQELGKLSDAAAKKAITEPLKGNRIKFSADAIQTIVRETSGYPYFIQFICREAYDIFRSQVHTKIKPAIPVKTLVKKLDIDFFTGRWTPVPDRQRELLYCIAHLENAANEFTVNEIAEVSRVVAKANRNVKPFKYGDVSAIMPKLINAGMVYKNRHGVYSLAVPLLHEFVRRQFAEGARKKATLNN